jgi:regulator of protease activity HflC (stomatin/prohibitin superfamily)
MKMQNCLMAGAVELLLSSCAIVRPGEVGMKQKLGKLQPGSLSQGAYVFNPFTTTVKKSQPERWRRTMSWMCPPKKD